MIDCLTFHVKEELLALSAADPVGGLAGVGAGSLPPYPLKHQAEVGEDDPVLHVLLQLLPLGGGGDARDCCCIVKQIFLLCCRLLVWGRTKKLPLPKSLT
jgi:hypothetical protein